MASFKALCLAGVASLVATAAGAADLLPPAPAPVYQPAPAPIAFGGGGWYLRGDVGVGISDFEQKASNFDRQIPGLRYDRNDLTDTGFIDAGVGYRFNEWFRADVTGEYRVASQFNATESYKNTGCKIQNGYGYIVPVPCTPKFGFAQRGYDNYSGTVQSIAGLVNGYVDIGTWYGVTPYIGAGVGVARVGFDNVVDTGFGAGSGGYGYTGRNYQTNFAYAAMAGLSFAVTQNLRMELGYRYLNEGNIATSKFQCTNSSKFNPCAREVQHASLAYNDIRLGFRYSFADFGVPAIGPSLPLIRKY